jgi:multidrug transporter EmrE-like cation transporter
MPWFVYSILSSILFVGLYLGIRWLTDRGFAPRQILLFMVGFALLGFFGATVPSLGKVLSSERFISFLAAGTFAGIFSSIGHWADFEAIKRAPNPGFSTSIRNSSILPVTLFSVVLFQSQFHFLKLGGVFLILAGIMALVIQRKPSSQEKGIRPANPKNHWVPLAFIALAGYTLTVLGMKKATLLGFSPPEICLCIYIVNFLFFSFICRKDMRSYFQDKTKLRFFLPLVFSCAFFAFAVNLLNVKGIELAPNPGYHEAIRNTNVLFLTFLAIPLFSASMDRQKILGVISTVVGIFILVL